MAAHLQGELQARRFEFSLGALAIIFTILGIAIYQFGLADGLTAGCIFLFSLIAHEAGHALVAKWFGVSVSAFGLCFRGAYIRRPRADGWREIAISVAGPAINLVLAFCFLPIAKVGYWLAGINLVLCFANLLPITGTDGWRILATLRSMRARRFYP